MFGVLILSIIYDIIIKYMHSRADGCSGVVIVWWCGSG